jgi:hypothetical protein
MTQTEQINALAALILKDTKERLARDYTQDQADRVTVEVIAGKKYVKIDRNHGHGYLMVDTTDGCIYGIKCYGQVHKGHYYGTLDTISGWNWGDFSPEKR